MIENVPSLAAYEVVQAVQEEQGERENLEENQEIQENLPVEIVEPRLVEQEERVQLDKGNNPRQEGILNIMPEGFCGPSRDFIVPRRNDQRRILEVTKMDMNRHGGRVHVHLEGQGSEVNNSTLAQSLLFPGGPKKGFDYLKDVDSIAQEPYRVAFPAPTSKELIFRWNSMTQHSDVLDHHSSSHRNRQGRLNLNYHSSFGDIHQLDSYRKLGFKRREKPRIFGISEQNDPQENNFWLIGARSAHWFSENRFALLPARA